MSRRPRIQFRGAIYHVMSRGNRKSAIFDDDGDRRAFLHEMSVAIERYAIKCYAYCLMGNHYHCVIETPGGNLSEAMKHLNGGYTQRSNRRHRRTGHIFEGRFKSILVGNDFYLRDVCRYVVLNPVRAHLVGDASAWPWSSYRATAGLDAAETFLFLDWIDFMFGGGGRVEAQRRYRLFVNDDVEKTSCLNTESPAIGPQEFQTEVRQQVGRTLHQASVPRIYRALGRPSLQELFAVAILDRSRRNALIQRAHVVHGYRLAEIAAFLRLHRSTPSAVVQRLERAGRAANSKASIFDT